MMKKALLVLAVAAFSSLIIYLIGGFDGCSSPRPCDLPAPQNLAVSVINETEASLVWSSVAGAVGYRVVVTKGKPGPKKKAPQLASTQYEEFTTDTSLLLIRLTPGSFYTAEVFSLCTKKNGSDESISTTWSQSAIIISDVDIMFPGNNDSGTGLLGDTCNCATIGSWDTISPHPDGPMEIPILTTSSSLTNARIIYGLKMSYDIGLTTFEDYTKIGIDRDCNEVNLDRSGGCTVDTLSCQIVDDTIIEYRLSDDNLLVKLTASAINDTIVFSVDKVDGYNTIIKYQRCENLWEGDCEEDDLVE